MLTSEFLVRNASLLLDALLAVGLIASLCLSLGAQRAIQRQARKHRKAVEELAGRIAAASPVVARAPQEPPPETVRSSSSGVRPMLNLNQRVQALRLLRRGQDIGHVSAVLGMTRKEIELLMRVQELAAARTAGQHAVGRLTAAEAPDARPSRASR
jgi:hypothetical protein